MIAYRDGTGNASSRTIWPFALGFFDCARVVVAWCELRESIRHFRCDRIMAMTESGERYPRPRGALMKEWREQEGIGNRPGSRTRQDEKPAPLLTETDTTDS